MQTFKKIDIPRWKPPFEVRECRAIIHSEEEVELVGLERKCPSCKKWSRVIDWAYTEGSMPDDKDICKTLVLENYKCPKCFVVFVK